MEHTFVKTYFRKPTWCICCNSFIWGVTYRQGHACTECKMPIHTKCEERLPQPHNCPGKRKRKRRNPSSGSAFRTQSSSSSISLSTRDTSTESSMYFGSDDAKSTASFVDTPSSSFSSTRRGGALRPGSASSGSNPSSPSTSRFKSVTISGSGGGLGLREALGVDAVVEGTFLNVEFSVYTADNEEHCLSDEGGTVSYTKHAISFQFGKKHGSSPKYSTVQIPLTNIYKFQSVGKHSLRLYCKDFRAVVFKFRLPDEASVCEQVIRSVSELYNRSCFQQFEAQKRSAATGLYTYKYNPRLHLVRTRFFAPSFANPPRSAILEGSDMSLSESSAFSVSEDSESDDGTVDTRTVAGLVSAVTRKKVSPSRWFEVNTENSDFSVVVGGAPVVALPCSSLKLEELAAHRVGGFVPTFCWGRGNGNHPCALLRCTRPVPDASLMADDALFETMYLFGNSARTVASPPVADLPIVVFDSGPQDPNLESIYQQYCEFEFFNTTVAPAQDVYTQLRSLCSVLISDWSDYLSSPVHVQWFEMKKAVMEVVVKAVATLNNDQVVVFQDPGAPYASPSTYLSLIQLMVDVDARTIDGFSRLMDQQWFLPGYPFSSPTTPLSEFFLFICCARELVVQHAAAFEFGTYFLTFFLDNVTNSTFADFSLRNANERSKLMPKLTSIFDYIGSHRDKFYHLSYKPQEEPLSVAIDCFSPWHSHFLRYNYTYIDTLIAFQNAASEARRTDDWIVQPKECVYLPFLEAIVDFPLLNLSSGVLSDISDNIRAFTQLKMLVVNSNKLSFIGGALPDTLTYFSATHNHLSVLPSHFGRLSQLAEVHLSHNLFTEMPPELCQLPLKALKLSHNQITRLPSSLSRLSNLEVLELEDNRLYSFPSSVLESMPNLQKLNLAKNSLSRLMGVASLLQLTELFVEDNHLSQFPVGLQCCTLLTTLDLSHNRISHLPIEIEELEVLEDLRLGSNAIATLPDTLGHCFHLKHLSVENNQVSYIPVGLWKCKMLETLNFNNNALAALSPGIGQLAELTEAKFAHNRLSGLPFTMANLVNLNVLELDHNPIESPLAEFVSGGILSTLGYLHDALNLQIKSHRIKLMIVGYENVGKTSVVRDLSKHWKEASEYGVSRQSDPSDRNGSDSGPLASSSVLRTASTTSYHSHSPRGSPMINSLSSSPKSTTRFAMHMKAFSSSPSLKPRNDKVSRDKERLSDHRPVHYPGLLPPKESLSRFTKLSTDGVDIDTFVFPATYNSKGELVPANRKKKFAKKKDEVISVNIWDFAGQLIYHTTHQFFISSRSIFVIVADLSKDNFIGGVMYWAHSLVARLRHPELIVVGTHVDSPAVSEEESLARVAEIKAKILEYFDISVDTFCVSTLTGQSMDEFRSHLEHVICAHQAMNEILPASYCLLEGMLRENALSLHTPVISRKELFAIASLCGLTTTKDVLTFTRLFHDMGTLLYFDTDPSLQDLVILEPRFLSTVMATLFTTRHSYAKKGLLKKDDLPQVLKKFPIEIHNQLLHFLVGFEVIIEVGTIEKSLADAVALGDDSLASSFVGKQGYLIPALLPPKNPSASLHSQWPKVRKEGTFEFNRIFQVLFLPTGVFSLLLVQLFEFQPIHSLWKDGMLAGSRNVHCGNSGDSLILIENRAVTPAQYLGEHEPRAMSELIVRVRGNSLDQAVVVFERVLECVYRIFVKFEKLQWHSFLTLPLDYVASRTYSPLVRTKSGTEYLHKGKLNTNKLMRRTESKRIAPPEATESRKGGPLSPRVVETVRASSANEALPHYTNIGKALAAIAAGSTTVAIGTTQTLLSDVAPDLLIDCSSVSLTLDSVKVSEEVLGEGGFATVKLGRTHDGVNVAVKQLRLSESERELESFREFRKETLVHAKLTSHASVVTLLALDIPSYTLVLEYMPWVLFDYLHDYSKDITWNLRLRVALDIAKGLKFLRSFNPPLAHLDLKSPNVMLSSVDANSSVCAKLADFGTTKAVAVPLTGREVDNPTWLAPEILSKSPYTELVDTYAFAVILWELLTRESYFGEVAFFSDLEDWVLAGRRPLVYNESPDEYVKLIHDCWNQKPSARPSMDHVLQVLEPLFSRADSIEKQWGFLLRKKLSSQLFKLKLVNQRSKRRLTLQNADKDTRVLLVGYSGIGKTSFMSRLSRYSFDEKVATTIGEELSSPFLVQSQSYLLFSPEFHHDIPYDRTEGVRHVEGCIILYDLTDKSSFRDILSWWKASSKKVPTVLVGNRLDESDAREVPIKQAISAAKKNGIHSFEVSAKTGEGVAEAMRSLHSEIVNKRERSREEEKKRMRLERQVSGAASSAGVRTGVVDDESVSDSSDVFAVSEISDEQAAPPIKSQIAQSPASPPRSSPQFVQKSPAASPSRRGPKARSSPSIGHNRKVSFVETHKSVPSKLNAHLDKAQSAREEGESDDEKDPPRVVSTTEKEGEREGDRERERSSQHREVSASPSPNRRKKERRASREAVDGSLSPKHSSSKRPKDKDGKEKSDAQRTKKPKKKRKSLTKSRTIGGKSVKKEEKG